MTRLVLAAALVAAAVPVAAQASETCYYRGSLAEVCRDAEYRACLLYGHVARVPFEAGNGCPA